MCPLSSAVCTPRSIVCAYQSVMCPPLIYRLCSSVGHVSSLIYRLCLPVGHVSPLTYLLHPIISGLSPLICYWSLPTGLSVVLSTFSAFPWPRVRVLRHVVCTSMTCCMEASLWRAILTSRPEECGVAGLVTVRLALVLRVTPGCQRLVALFAAKAGAVPVFTQRCLPLRCGHKDRK
jgi:hypothetical protein